MKCDHCGGDFPSKAQNNRGITNGHLPQKWAYNAAKQRGLVWGPDVARKGHWNVDVPKILQHLCHRCHIHWTEIEHALIADALARVAAEMVRLNGELKIVAKMS